MVAARRAFLLTWNPNLAAWDPGYREAIERTAAGENVDERWATGSRRRGVAPGDRAYLLRVGTPDRGIVASAGITGEIEQAPHWNGSRRVANIVDVRFDVVVPPEDALATRILQHEFPDQHWTPQGSGTMITSHIVDDLAQFWADHVAELRGGAARR